MLNIAVGAPPAGPRPAAATVPVATPAQAEVLSALTSAGPCTAAELAARLGQHTNTAREHLDVLVAQRLAERERESPAGRGRPAYRYAATPPAAEGGAYRSLVEALVEQFVAAGPAERAVELGRRVRLTPAAATTRPGSAAKHRVSRAVAEAMAGLGFATEPVPGGRGLRLLTCPLLSLAREHERVVCGFHHGILQSVTQRAGADPDSVTLTPFAEPGACLVRWAPA